MAVQTSYPGVYIEEFAPGAPIQGVGTSTAAFIGVAARGDMDTPTKVTSWDQFLATFGDQPVPGFYLWYAVRGFFENGGQVCYVVRASNGRPAYWTINTVPAGGGLPVIRVVARQPGAAAPAITVADAPLLLAPDFAWFFAGFEEGASPLAVILLVAPVAIVTMAEHIGDQIVLGRVVGRNFLASPGLHRTLLGDGLATSLAALVGGPPNTTYGENIGVMAITRVFSAWVIAGAAVLAVLLGFVGVLAAFLATIPTAVMGGVSIALFGVIASSGIRTLIEGRVDLGDRRNLLIVSTILVIGIGGATLSFAGGAFTVSSMALAAILGVLLNAVLPGRRSGIGREEPETVLASHG